MNGVGARGGGASRGQRANSITNRSEGLSSSRPDSAASSGFGFRATSPETLPQFFHADDAKPTIPRTQPQASISKLELQDHPYTSEKDNSRSRSSQLASPEPNNDHPKFFYADLIRETKPQSPGLANVALSGRPPLRTIFSSQPFQSPPHRPPSPLKDEVTVSRHSSVSKPSPRRHTRLVSNGHNDIRLPEPLTPVTKDGSRRSSLVGHTRRTSQPPSPATATFASNASRRSSITNVDLAPSGVPKASFGMVAQMLCDSQTADISAEPTQTQSLDEAAPAGQSKLDHLNELAANARRERKVLDLEISNSSLLAINRTLEAQMRKQKAELRHLRRSRTSGRFLSSTRSASSRFSAISGIGDPDEIDSSAEEDAEDADGFSNLSATSDDTSFPDSTNFSPTTRSSLIPLPNNKVISTGQSPRQHWSLKLDLAAQRTLLQDSQKLNQALKRCLGRTDELIFDGKKALDYRVNVEDLETLGPRVLVPEEGAEEVEMRRGLLSPGIEHAGMANPWERVRTLGDAFEILPDTEAREKDGLLTDEIKEEVEEGRKEEVLLDEKREAQPMFQYVDPGIDTNGATTPAPEEENEEEKTRDENRRRLSPIDTGQGTEVNTDIIATSSIENKEQGVEKGGVGLYGNRSSILGSPSKGFGGLMQLVGGAWAT